MTDRFVLNRFTGGAQASGRGTSGATLSDLEQIFKPYDIRGVVPDQLDEAVAEQIGAGFARLTNADQLVVIHDMRTSSQPLADAIARGAASQGELFLKRPGKARFAYAPPSGLTVVSDGGRVIVHLNDRICGM